MDALGPVALILLFEKSQRCFFFMLPFASSFKFFINEFTFLYVKANSKEIGEEILFPSFFRKMLMSACFFFLGVPRAFAKIYFFRMAPILRKNLRIK